MRCSISYPTRRSTRTVRGCDPYRRRWIMRPHRIAVLVLLLALLPTDRVFAQDPDPADGPVFVARDVEPTLENTEELKHILRRVYPSGYRDTGLDVTTILWVYVEADGRVGSCEVLRSSGYVVFDRAAEQLAECMLFTPALRDNEPLGVWIHQAVHFKSGDSGNFGEGPAMVADDVVRSRDSAQNRQEDDKP